MTHAEYMQVLRAERALRDRCAECGAERCEEARARSMTLCWQHLEEARLRERDKGRLARAERGVRSRPNRCGCCAEQGHNARTCPGRLADAAA